MVMVKRGKCRYNYNYHKIFAVRLVSSNQAFYEDADSGLSPIWTGNTDLHQVAEVVGSLGDVQQRSHRVLVLAAEAVQLRLHGRGWQQKRAPR